MPPVQAKCQVCNAARRVFASIHFMGIAAAVGCAKVAAEAIDGHISQHEIEDDARFFPQFLVLCEIDQRHQRGDIRRVIDIGKPLAEATAKAQFQPAQQARPERRHLLATSPARGGKYPIRVELPGEIGAGGEQDEMVFRPGHHGLSIGGSRYMFEFVGPELEVDHRVLDQLALIIVQCLAVSVMREDSQKTGQGKICGIGAVVQQIQVFIKAAQGRNHAIDNV